MLLQIQLEEIIEKLQGKFALYYNFVTEAEIVLFVVTTTWLHDSPNILVFRQNLPFYEFFFEFFSSAHACLKSIGNTRLLDFTKRVS